MYSRLMHTGAVTYSAAVHAKMEDVIISTVSVGILQYLVVPNSFRYEMIVFVLCL